MKPIVALAGRKQSGKDTVAAYLVSKGYSPGAFSDPVKSMLRAIGVPFESLYGTDEQKNEFLPLFGMSGRTLMQLGGTDFGREMIRKDIWVRIFFAREHAYPVVISDVRFNEEVVAIREHGGVVIGLRRDRPGVAADTHISESGVDSLNVDIWIDNDGTPADLFSKVEEFLA